jgi:hypothetical protein
MIKLCFDKKCQEEKFKSIYFKISGLFLYKNGYFIEVRIDFQFIIIKTTKLQF